MVEGILRATNAEDYWVFLTSTDKSNFRMSLYPEYKANRVLPKPTWYSELRAHIASAHSGIVVSGREADDEMADRQTEKTVICSIDKDMDQIPGKHYDFVKNENYQVTPESGLRWFYYQLLCGDATDNVPGIRGCGPRTASRILDSARTEEEYFRLVYDEYSKKYGEDGPRLMLLYGRLLKIGGELWAPDALVNIVQDSKPSSDEPSNVSDSNTSPVN